MPFVARVVPEGPTELSAYANMRAFSISEENSERVMLKTINYLTKSENKGETESKHI